MIINLRDLGGYRGKDGRKVRKNLLFRSGNLNFATPILAEALNPLNIAMVFDLRTVDEVRKQPYTLPHTIGYGHRPIFETLDDGEGGPQLDYPEDDRALQALNNLQIPDLTGKLDGFMNRLYLNMGEKPGVFGEIMKEIIGQDGKPVLFHCVAGKDRTGFLATVILLALGVSKADVRENYLLSNDYRRKEIEQETKRIQANLDNPDLAEMIGGMLLVKEEYLEASLGVIDSHASFDDYAESRLGLGLSDLEALRNLYLE